MSTRSAVRTRQASRAESSAQDAASPPAPPAAHDEKEKENVKFTGPSGRTRVTRKSSSKAYCICKKPDDGSPMIHCASCKDWFHFRCVELSEQDAEEIQLYICPSCHQKTGARTIKEWEGADAVQESLSAELSVSKSSSTPSSKKKSNGKHVTTKVEKATSDTSSDASEEFNPHAEHAPKTRTRRQAYHSDDESDSGASHRGKSPKRLRHSSAAPKEPAPKQSSPAVSSSQPKRKKSVSTHVQPPAKRPRSESTSGDDAVRKYCLGKLQALFCDIFVRYPFLPLPEGEQRAELKPDKKPEELTPEEKEQIETRAKQFGTDLEQAMFEIYSEPDKQGKQVAAGKYKERFRMLTFNLSKADRVVLHMRIASSRISPRELSTMSSTDLASEVEQQSIKKLEEEALAHSILRKATVPRAKLTHKGLQDIEDVTGAGQREAEREREDEEEERIERERLARLRQQAQRAQSQGSAPPESPVVPHTPTWGAPPPVPPHAAPDMSPSATAAAAASAVSLGRPLFVPSASDFAAGLGETELNLADLINIDEEPSGEVAMTPVDAIPTPFGEAPPLLPPSAPSDRASPSTASPVTPAPTGISPFAAKGSQPDLAHRPSFDLNALWTPSADTPMEGQASASPEPQDTQDAMVTEPTVADVELAPETEDQDFDMFLNADGQDAEPQQESNEPVAPAPEEKPATVEDLPPVWSGTVSMPLDSAIPQEVAVVARQTGGRTLGHDSPLWRTLFPSPELRIDGRVPVEKSAQYLTQVRLNPTKELIAAAFSPVDGTDPSGFHAVKNHLVSKNRHGLIFPWGHNPKSSAPGRELYVVPLLSSDPIPEYMELLDQLQLPPTRSVDYLVGIWVLNKGKLAAPPAPAAQPVAPPTQVPPPPTPAPHQPSVMPNIDMAKLQHLGLLQPHPPSQTPPPPPPSQSVPPVPPHPQPTPPVPPPPVNLATEVAQLTPEQIQLMLQTLAKTSHAAPVPVPVQPQPHPEPYAIPLPLHAMTPAAQQQQPAVPPQPIALPQAALQAWSSPGGAPPYPGPAPYQQHPPHQHQRGGFPGAQQPYGGERPYHNHNHNPGSGFEYERGFRGGRGGRGRGGNGGWQKPRGRGGPANRSRGRGGWGGDQQR